MSSSRILRSLLTAPLVLALGFGIGTVASRLTLPTAESQQVESYEPVAFAPVQASYTPWDQSIDPNYYRVIGKAVTRDAPPPGTVRYGELDELGRATGAVTVVTYDSMEAGMARSRENTSDIEPSGWGHNEEVDIAMPDGSVYHGLLFNRSHLIAKSLGGSEELRNLITGTRTQNVGANVNGSEGGMAYAEGMVRTWLYSHRGGTVYYAATPVYEGNELVCRSVMVDVLTSDGSINQRVEVFNAARGFAIDYATGMFTRTEDAQDAARAIRGELDESVPYDGQEVEGDALSISGEPSADDPVADTPDVTQPEDEDRLVIVTGSGKAYHHDESCKGLAQANRMEWVSVAEAESMGRHPCGICGG